MLINKQVDDFGHIGMHECGGVDGYIFWYKFGAALILVIIIDGNCFPSSSGFSTQLVFKRLD